MRRGHAYAACHELARASADLEAAAALNPADLGVVRDLEELRGCAVPLDAAGLRARGEWELTGWGLRMLGVDYSG